MTMDRKTLEKHLEQADRRVASGWRNLARQTDLVVDRKLKGKDITDARRMLFSFEDLMDVYLAARDQLRQRLSRIKRGH